MEGLIPLVLKALKKNRVRRRYECLSTGAAETYNISDFYLNDNNNSPHVMYMTHSAGKMEDRYSHHHHHHRHHRRHKSIGEFYGYSANSGGGGGGGGSPPPPSPPMAKQLVRFRSHRMFSCVTGAS